MAEGFYQPQTKVDWSSNQAYAQFKLWRKEVERIIHGPLAEKNSAVKMNHIYIWAGAHAEVLVDACKSEDPTKEPKSPKALLDLLGGCLTHSTVFREAREDFYNIKQKSDENTTTYFSRIMDLHRLAEFPANTNYLIVDKLIHGCSNIDCKRKLMAKDKDVLITDCLELMRKFEAIEVTMKRLGESKPTPNPDDCVKQLNAAYKDPTQKSQQRGSRSRVNSKKPKKCPWCSGEAHGRDKCPAKTTTCTFCHKEGHFEKSCFKKKAQYKQKSPRRQNVVEASEIDSDDSYEFHDIASVYINSVNSHREVLAEVEFLPKSRPSYTKFGKVDTGAMVSCMPRSMVSDMGLSNKDLSPSNTVLTSASKKHLTNHGTLLINVACNGHNAKVKFYVINSGTDLLLGLNFCKDFNLVRISPSCIQREVSVQHNDSPELSQDAVHIMRESEADYPALRKKWGKHLPLGKRTGDPLQDLKLIFPDMFDGQVGVFEGEVQLRLSPEAVPVQLPPRAVPQSVMSKLKKELDKMEKEGIIRPCPETTEWVHNLVIVVKKDGSLRLCLDPRNLNKYLVRSVHYTASWEDVQHSFQNGLYFSTLDAKSGYWTKRLSPESQSLTAFNTPFKKYCFLRLPFGLSVSAEIFCEQMDKALDGIPGTFPCADDVKVQGSSEERHDLHLLETVDKAREAGVKFNPDKCCIKKQRIEYFGRIVTPQGVEPCAKKVRAIAQLSPPTDKQELQSFFGTVNFMSTFIPNLAKKTYLMRGLLKKNVKFLWTSDMDVEFNSIKESIIKATQLVHYDLNKPVVIETDASLKGLGAVLLQDGQPVRFLSKSLTPAETEYSGIERELLAVLFACEKLHVYTFGREVSINTDHKPLEAIFKKAISLASARLQRMLLRLAKYNLKVRYVGAKSVLVADTLSRLILPGKDKAVPGLDVTIAQVLSVNPSRLESLQEETKSDPILCQLQDLIKYGWAESMQDLPIDLHPFWCYRDELVMLDGLVMKNNRILIPTSMREGTLARLHEGHHGQSSMLRRARRTVFWPKIQDDITQLVERCPECQIHAKKTPRIPERQISASRPLEIIGVDLMDFKGQHALVCVDYYSGYLFYDIVAAQTSKEIIKTLNVNFRKFWPAERIISDNGPCFKAEEFREFCKGLEIKHTTSSPHYHESNGRAERAIQTVKQMLRKCKNESEITLALLAYHDTPINDSLPSPSELMFNRRISTRLNPIPQPSTLSDTQKAHLAEKRASHLKPTTNQEEFTPNQPIWFTDDTSSEWKPGFIESKDLLPHAYFIVNEQNNRRMRRNRHDLKPRFPIANEKRGSEIRGQFEPAKQGQLGYAPICWPSSNIPMPELNNSPETEPIKTGNSRCPATPSRVAKPPSNVSGTPSRVTKPNPSVSSREPQNSPALFTRSGRQSKPFKDPAYQY